MPILKNKLWISAVALLACIYCFIEAGGYGDFYIFLSATGRLLQHQNIYETRYVDGYNYFYSVLFALVLVPFYSFPYFVVKLFWLLLNVFLYAHLFKLMAESDMVKQLSQKRQRILLFGVFLFSLRFLRDNLHTSQITILILWCCVYGLYLIHRNRPVAGSAILALGINIKLLPLVFLPYLFYRGHFKAGVLTILFCGLALISPSLLIGHEYNMSLLKSWLNLINPVQARHVLDVDERSFHSLSTLMATLLVKDLPADLYALPIRRNIADVSLQTLQTILGLIRLALIAFTLYFLRWPPFRGAKSAFRCLIEISYLLLLIPLIFPHQQHYAFLFAAPAFALCLYFILWLPDAFSKKEKNAFIACLVLIYLSANSKLLLGAFNDYYEHFKILTYGALLLIPMLAWVQRKAAKHTLLLPKN